MATSTFGASPGVRMSWSEKWIWKPETPGSDPAGARISAGKSGSVERSFPSSAVSLAKRPPVSCMPSPESPANRMITCSSCSTGLAMTFVQRYSTDSGDGAADALRIRMARYAVVTIGAMQRARSRRRYRRTSPPRFPVGAGRHLTAETPGPRTARNCLRPSRATVPSKTTSPEPAGNEDRPDDLVPRIPERSTSRA